MTIRQALIAGMFTTAILATTLVGALGLWSLDRSVRREAQARVDHDLRMVETRFTSEQALFAQRFEQSIAGLDITRADLGDYLARIRRAEGATVLNICAPDGTPIAGAFPDRSVRTPVADDTVIRAALKGEPAWGTLVIPRSRLAHEGGDALIAAATVSESETGEIRTGDALFWWVACPLYDASGRIVAVAYGGRCLNHNDGLVDSLREQIFGNDRYHGKPLGAVTLFLRDVRVATNVLGPDGRRAGGTVVSAEVRDHVLGEGAVWSDRAFVVDEWYISSYLPLIEPSGAIIGMLYVGLLEEPYRDERARLVREGAVPLLLVLIAALILSMVVVRRITVPLRNLLEAARGLEGGEWHTPLPSPGGFREIGELAHAFGKMRDAVRERDQSLRDTNRELAMVNDSLDRTNQNYMNMLGFVTHELKSPLAGMQTMIDVMAEDMAGNMPEDARMFLARIRTSAEEMQDMVKNYLDLSRVERGELTAHFTAVRLKNEVIDPVIAQTGNLLTSRGQTLTVACPDDLIVQADPELLRIALTNYLTNAAKYGRDGGAVRCTVQVREEGIQWTVWNEGEGFTEEERVRLFGKFTRLKNRTTIDSRGSGLGLFLCHQIAEQHHGTVWAESKPGSWALFGFRIPAAPEISV